MGELVRMHQGRLGGARVDTVSELLARHASLRPGETGSRRVTLVGRVVGVRHTKSRSVFLDLNDGSGVIQVYAGDCTPGFEDLIASGRPMIKVFGKIFRTRGNALAIRLQHWDEV